MSEFTDTLTEKHVAMIEQQPVFFVATAAADARINLSPKGYDSFRVIAPDRVAYLDLGGSGNETHAHLVADGRITIMFCNFDRPALILRIYGHGKACYLRTLVGMIWLGALPFCRAHARSSISKSTACRLRVAGVCRSWSSNPNARRSGKRTVRLILRIG